MLKTALSILLALASFLAGAADPADAAGAKDPPLFTRMPGYHIYRSEVIDFDRVEFWVSRSKSQAVEGRRYSTTYYPNEGIRQPSPLQVTRNYAGAAKAAGGQTVYEYEDGGTQTVVLKLAKGDSEFWTQVSASSNGIYDVLMIEKQAMAQDVTANAGAWAGSIRETGKAAVYGILFDTGKSEVKPQSEAALQEVAKLLAGDPQLRLLVVGHTDGVGALESNMKLSQARAESVVKALVARHGIAAARLRPQGAGPISPVATNRTEDGRAKNRRVELVEQ